MAVFNKILIANRGEIACRIIRTAQRLGIGTVAVFSDADRAALPVSMADEAVHIGAAPAVESYLQGGRIIEAARKTKTEAIHPGYGFLSENAQFAEAVEAAGIIFIGPPAQAIRAMGLKDAAKELMREAGVPVVPGYHGENQNPQHLGQEAERIGYPVLIKARAGGGGKGMRLVRQAEDFVSALEGAKREAVASFGDPHCLIEKYLEQSRHIEIQIFGDAQGNVVHLFERDCSLQRRHQKVMEEAPAPGMSGDMRTAMGEAAVKAAKAVGYTGAGTVEFIADVSQGLNPDRFYFMEMNTRLQVEHPVTEAITGLDLVELQLRAASGEALPFTQGDLAIQGHAIEARIYSEDVSRGFLPATGRITHLRFPGTCDGVRIDAGVRQGDEITPYYDPMIAKLIVHDANRESALAKLRSALREAEIAGPITNLAFLGKLAANSEFVKGHIDTRLIERDSDALTAQAQTPRELTAIAALVALGHVGGTGKMPPDPWKSLRSFRAWGRAEQSARFIGEGSRLDARVAVYGGGRYEIAIGNERLSPVILTGHENRARYAIDGHEFDIRFARDADAVTLFHDGETTRFARYYAEAHSDDTVGGDAITAPMPGLVKLVNIMAGKPVAKGEILIVLEAMKMEYALKAPRNGTIAEVLVAAGDQVENGALLLLLHSADAGDEEAGMNEGVST